VNLKKRVAETIFILLLLLCGRFNLLYSQSYLITNIAGQRKFGYSGDGGLASNAHLGNPISVYADNAGNIYISDWGNSRLRVVNSSGIISTIAGNGVYGFSGDGGAATLAELGGPMGIFVDNLRNIYVADIGNERIRKIDASAAISTIAGNGMYGFSGDGGPAVSAEFDDPAGICGDESGNIYVADEFNNRIRKISSGGIISTVAGCGARGYSGDGGAATLAEFYYPSGVAVDVAGNIFIADESNNCIRKVNLQGIISTIAGNGVSGYMGDGGPAVAAELNNAAGIGLDRAGNIYIADGFNSRIRKINTDGVISTIAGNGKAGYTGAGDTAILASLYNPVSISADTAGNLYLANEFNNFVQKLSLFPETSGKPGITVYPNPNRGSFTIRIQNFSSPLRLEVYNILGQRISYRELNAAETFVNLNNPSAGVYLYRVFATNNKVYDIGKVVVF
jgi:sugar lactone lactonase YvrE